MKTMKHYLYSSIVYIGFTLILVACSDTSVPKEVTIEEVQKQDFYVSVRDYQDFWNNYELQKVGKLSSAQNILLTSKANGTIRDVLVYAGQKVQKWQVLATLSDTIANYGLSLDRARNGLERARINYDSTKISLDKQVFDAEINVQKLENNLEALKNDTNQSIKKAEIDLENSQVGYTNSKASLDVQKIDNSISKSELDYEKTLTANSETIQGYRTTIKKEYNALTILLTDVITLGDELFGVWERYKDDAKVYRDYFGGRNTSQKQTTYNELLALMNYKNGDFTRINVSSDMSEDEILTSISQILWGFEQVKDFLNNLETTLNNSIASVDVFSDTTISGYVTTVGTYTTSLQASYATIISFESTVSSFLQTYKDTEASLQKQIELLKQDREILVKSLGISELGAEIGYERTIIGTDDQISSLDLQLQIAKNTYDNAIKTRSVNLRNLQNAINEAQIAYNQAKNEYDKLTITSPIDGTIGSVMLDAGQEVTVGTRAFEILNTGTPEITIALSLQEQSLVTPGNEVYVRVGTKKYTGTIVSVSSIADANLQYETTIIMKESFATLGDIVDIMIPVGSDEVLVPINIVDVNGAEWGEGYVYFVDGIQISKMKLRLGSVYGNQVEVLACVNETKLQTCEDELVITSDISQFDPEKYVLKIKE